MKPIAVIVEVQHINGKPTEWLLSFDGPNPKDGHFFPFDNAREVSEAKATWESESSVYYEWFPDGSFVFRWNDEKQQWMVFETSQYSEDEYHIMDFAELPEAVFKRERSV